MAANPRYKCRRASPKQASSCWRSSVSRMRGNRLQESKAVDAFFAGRLRQQVVEFCCECKTHFVPRRLDLLTEPTGEMKGFGAFQRICKMIGLLLAGSVCPRSLPTVFASIAPPLLPHVPRT